MLSSFGPDELDPIGMGIGMLIPGTPWLAFVAMALYAAGNGMLTIARGTLPLVLFGAPGYGARMGLLARPMLLAQATGPIAAAITLDKLGSQAPLARWRYWLPPACWRASGCRPGHNPSPVEGWPIANYPPGRSHLRHHCPSAKR